MGKKMKFPFLFKATETTTTTTTTPATAATWPWPACVNSPKTLSFRTNTNTSIHKTMNSAYLDDKNTTTEFAETPDSFFSIRSSSDHEETLSSAASEVCEAAKNDETAVIGGLRSDRLFFEPGETSSILEEAKSHDFPNKQGVKIMAMDSSDPFMDFRASMEEVVAAHGLKDWECMEELLACYLRVNGKSNHGYIVGAFVDLLISLALASASSNECSTSAIDERCSSSSTATQYSFTSPLSFSSSSTYSSTSPCLSLLENEDEIAVEKNVSSCSSGV